MIKAGTAPRDMSLPTSLSFIRDISFLRSHKEQVPETNFQLSSKFQIPSSTNILRVILQSFVHGGQPDMALVS